MMDSQFFIAWAVCCDENTNDAYVWALQFIMNEGCVTAALVVAVFRRST